MKVYGGDFDFGIRWRCFSVSRPYGLPPGGNKNTGVHSVGGCVGFRDSLYSFGEE